MLPAVSDLTPAGGCSLTCSYNCIVESGAHVCICQSGYEIVPGTENSGGTCRGNIIKILY